jgi:hypothetical protein
MTPVKKPRSGDFLSLINIKYSKGGSVMQVNQILKERSNVSKTKTNNVKRSNVNGNEVHRIAQTLADRFNDQGSFNYFCSIAWQLPEYIINNNFEAAQKGREPVRLFTWLCNKAIQEAHPLAASK